MHNHHALNWNHLLPFPLYWPTCSNMLLQLCDCFYNSLFRCRWVDNEYRTNGHESHGNTAVISRRWSSDQETNRITVCHFKLVIGSTKHLTCRYFVWNFHQISWKKCSHDLSSVVWVKVFALTGSYIREWWWDRDNSFIINVRFRAALCNFDVTIGRSNVTEKSCRCWQISWYVNTLAERFHWKQTVHFNELSSTSKLQQQQPIKW